ncbi:hypothetical protein [Geobacillus sp. FJAT-46040]|uniref:hypothetical protein n=1 Tax=Geobacillus sp. FJAT-46040 TaxID=2011017 RepID=UPI000BB987A4|nr:hypothetical protein [Geobacillus sp. FJAT-46040]
MKLENAREKLFFQNKEIDGLFNFLSTVELSGDDKKAVQMSIILLMNHPDFKNKRKRILNVIFADNDSVNLSFSENQIGSQANYAMFRYEKWTRLSELQKIICLVEEYVHHFWDTDDEIEVSKIVCQIVPGITFDPENGNYIFLNS